MVRKVLVGVDRLPSNITGVDSRLVSSHFKFKSDQTNEYDQEADDGEGKN
jgi:hypothetical protein